MIITKAYKKFFNIENIARRMLDNQLSSNGFENSKLLTYWNIIAGEWSENYAPARIVNKPLVKGGFKRILYLEIQKGSRFEFQYIKEEMLKQINLSLPKSEKIDELKLFSPKHP